MMDKEKIRLLQKQDAAIDILTRLRGMLGACIYLMGGENRHLENEHADFEIWFGDIQDRLDEAIEAIGEIR